MSHWPYIVAAYGITAAFILSLTAWSLRAMRRAEAEAEQPGREQ